VDLLRRLAGLFALAVGLLWLAWWVGYHWLPEGLLAGKNLAGNLPLEHLSRWPRAAAIFGWNLLWAGVFAGAANLLRVRRWPLGFTAVLGLWLLYGLTLGTNSFAEPLAVRPAPSLTLLLQRSGIFEMSAYLLIAVATARQARWEQARWWGGPLERLSPPPLVWGERALIVMGLLLLVGAAVRETLMWCQQAGCQ
jgi:hypothetical protein